MWQIHLHALPHALDWVAPPHTLTQLHLKNLIIIVPLTSTGTSPGITLKNSHNYKINIYIYIYIYISVTQRRVSITASCYCKNNTSSFLELVDYRILVTSNLLVSNKVQTFVPSPPLISYAIAYSITYRSFYFYLLCLFNSTLLIHLNWAKFV